MTRMTRQIARVIRVMPYPGLVGTSESLPESGNPSHSPLGYPSQNQPEHLPGPSAARKSPSWLFLSTNAFCPGRRRSGVLALRTSRGYRHACSSFCKGRRRLGQASRVGSADMAGVSAEAVASVMLAGQTTRMRRAAGSGRRLGYDWGGPKVGGRRGFVMGSGCRT